MAETCNICKSIMTLTGKRTIGDTEYKLYKCEKCNRVVARRVN